MLPPYKSLPLPALYEDGSSRPYYQSPTSSNFHGQEEDELTRVHNPQWGGGSRKEYDESPLTPSFSRNKQRRSIAIEKAKQEGDDVLFSHSTGHASSFTKDAFTPIPFKTWFGVLLIVSMLVLCGGAELVYFLGESGTASLCLSLPTLTTTESTLFGRLSLSPCRR